MRALVAIAKNTFREAVRDRIFHMLVAFGAAFVLSGFVLKYVTVGDPRRILLNVGLASIHLLGAVIAITVGAGMVYKEVAKRTVFTLLSKPVTRRSFLLGKYLGLVAVLAVQLVALTVLFHVAYRVVGGRPTPSILTALAMMGVELAVLAAAVLFFSSFAGPFTSGFLSLFFFLIGHSIGAVAALTRTADPEFQGKLQRNVAHGAWEAVVAVFPDLERFNLKEEALYQIHVSVPHVLGVTAYGALLIGVFLLAACLVFERRDFN